MFEKIKSKSLAGDQPAAAPQPFTWLNQGKRSLVLDYRNSEGAELLRRLVLEADVLIDASEAFYFEDENRPASGQRVQFKSRIIHELGHVLGLGHVENEQSGSVMFPKLQFGQLRPELTPLINDNGEKVYRLCQIIEVNKGDKTYKFPTSNRREVPVSILTTVFLDIMKG